MKFTANRFRYCTYETNPDDYTLHRNINGYAHCNLNIQLEPLLMYHESWIADISEFKNICQKCLASYSKKSIDKIKREYIVRKLKGKNG